MLKYWEEDTIFMDKWALMGYLDNTNAFIRVRLRGRD